MANPIQTTTRIVSKGSRLPFKKIGSMFFIGIFIIIPILYSIIISIEAKSPLPGISYLGEKFLEPTKVIYQESLRIYEDGGVYVRTGNSLSDLFRVLIVYWTIFQALWITWRWLKILAKLWGNSPASTSVQNFANYFLAVLTFLGTQTLFLSIDLAIQLKNQTLPLETKIMDYIAMPFKAWFQFIKSSPFFIKQFNMILDPSTAPNQTIMNTINNSINLTNMSI